MAERSRPSGPWGDRVRFGPGGTAFTPGIVAVPAEGADLAARTIAERGLIADGAEAEPTERVGGAFVEFSGIEDVPVAVTQLRHAGVAAQPDHVLFATCGCGPCPPHPSTPKGRELAASPFYANPFYANPFYANAGGCCCGGAGANPFYANPFYANPFYANPFYANATTNPSLAPDAQATGRRRSSARPAPDVPAEPSGSGDVADVRIAVLDTGWAQSHRPSGLSSIRVTEHGGDDPDEDADRYLDPAAGHGTFIAGVIEQAAPGCLLELFAPLTSYGDGSEAAIADLLLELARRPDDERPHLVNLSFGGYSPLGMAMLAHPIAALRTNGVVVVASAGNDATCVPMFPAALPGVVSVGAVDRDGEAAPFTNYGPWVRACAEGVDVVSLFFEGFNGAEPAVAGHGDEDDFRGWAVWSGTSFAAPRVAAALAREIGGGLSGNDAVTRLVDDPARERKPMLGTYVR